MYYKHFVDIEVITTFPIILYNIDSIVWNIIVLEFDAKDFQKDVIHTFLAMNWGRLELIWLQNKNHYWAEKWIYVFVQYATRMHMENW